MTERLLTVAQAATIAGVNATSMYPWIEHQEIAARKVNGKWMITATDEELRALGLRHPTRIRRPAGRDQVVLPVNGTAADTDYTSLTGLANKLKITPGAARMRLKTLGLFQSCIRVGREVAVPTKYFAKIEAIGRPPRATKLDLPAEGNGDLSKVDATWRTMVSTIKRLHILHEEDHKLLVTIAADVAALKAQSSKEIR